MNDTPACANHEALIAYLYDECEPAERAATAAHIAQCRACAEEIASLRDTRAHLAAWAPPEMPLGFQITRVEEAQSATVLRPAQWWRRPLPAWAQAAAAVAIFAAGLSAGAARQAPTGRISSTPAASTAPALTTPAVSRDDVARFEQRLRAIENAERVQPAAVRTVSAHDDAALMARVEQLVAERVAESEARQQTLLRRVAREVDAHSQLTQRVVAIQDTTTQELLQQRQALGTLATRVSFSPAGAR